MPDPSPVSSPRYPLVDALRGVCMISMVAFHFCYDVFMVYGRDPGWYGRPAAHLWQQSICWGFILLSGFVWPWGRRSCVRRGLVLNLCGLVVTAVTVIALPDEAIWFGVLSFMGCAVLLLLAVEKPLRAVPPAAGLAVSFVLFRLFRQVQDGVLGLAGMRVALPAALYRYPLLTLLGFPYPGFYSSDYFPMLPWFFLYLCGYFLQGIFARQPRWQRAARRNVPVLSALGKHSLAVYMIHQPLCMLLCMLLFSG